MTRIPPISCCLRPYCLMIGFLMIGCQPAASHRSSPLVQPMPIPTSPSSGSMMADPSVPADPDALPRELNNARAAAQFVAMQPAVADPEARREIALYVILFRAAHETNVGDFTRHFLLDPLPDDDLHAPPAMPPREFFLRILGGLDDLHVPIAWGSRLDRNPVEKEHYPGTVFLATRLRIRITEYGEGGRLIKGELSDWTESVGSSRQGFTATWDGTTWSIRRDRVRLVQ